MKGLYLSARLRLGLALGLSSLASIGLYVAGNWGMNERAFAYMIWNLFLAWIALAITLWLERTVQRNLWSSWYALAVTFLWVIFLPNTFYMITDYIHIQELSAGQLLHGVFTFTAFVFNGVLLGILSLYAVHLELLKRISARAAALLIGLVILLSSFAMYIGRVLRWNSWDIIANPSSLLFDVTDRLINLGQHPRLVSTIMGFFILIGSLYVVVWHMARVARNQREFDK